MRKCDILLYKVTDETQEKCMPYSQLQYYTKWLVGHMYVHYILIHATMQSVNPDISCDGVRWQATRLSTDILTKTVWGHGLESVIERVYRLCVSEGEHLTSCFCGDGLQRCRSLCAQGNCVDPNTGVCDLCWKYFVQCFVGFLHITK